MAKYTVAEASEILGITKEAIYNRIRRGTLQSITEEGVKHVVLSQDNATHTNGPKASSVKTPPADERYVELLKTQLEEIKAQAKKLEEDKARLISEKEALLVHSKEEVERIYKERDKQLKAILALATRPLLERQRLQENTQTDSIDADFEELTPYEKEMVAPQQKEEWINVTLLMQQKGYSAKKQKKRNQVLISRVGFSEDIREENGILFIRRGKKLKEILAAAPKHK